MNEYGSAHDLQRAIRSVPFVIIPIIALEAFDTATFSLYISSALDLAVFGFLVACFCASFMIAALYFFLQAQISSANAARFFFVCWAAIIAEQDIQAWLFPDIVQPYFTFANVYDASEAFQVLAGIGISVACIWVGMRLAGYLRQRNAYQ